MGSAQRFAEEAQAAAAKAMKDDERRMETMYEARMSHAEEKVPYALYPTSALCPIPYTLYPTPLHVKEKVRSTTNIC